MDNPAQVSDLTARGWTGDTNVGKTRLDEAWRALRREVPGLEAAIAAETITEADVIDVLCAAVLRILRNPEGLEQESGQIDDYTESWRRADATMDLYFTSAELRRLSPPDPFVGGWSGSVRYC